MLRVKAEPRCAGQRAWVAERQRGRVCPWGNHRSLRRPCWNYANGQTMSVTGSDERRVSKRKRRSSRLTYCRPMTVVNPWPQCWQLYLNPPGELGDRVQTLPFIWCSYADCAAKRRKQIPQCGIGCARAGLNTGADGGATWPLVPLVDEAVAEERPP